MGRSAVLFFPICVGNINTLGWSKSQCLITFNDVRLQTEEYARIIKMCQNARLDSWQCERIEQKRRKIKCEAMKAVVVEEE